MNRRGYGDLTMDASTARVTLFGFDEERQLMLEVNRKLPGHPIAVIGFSCGSGVWRSEAGFAGRYGALRSHLSAWTDSWDICRSLSRRCEVGYDPGFHVMNAMKKVPVPYRWGLDLAFRYQYVYRHRETWRQKSPASAEVVEATGAAQQAVLDPGKSFIEAYRNVTKLSGRFGCSNTWLEKQQPSLEDMKVPCLLINSLLVSKDDPICVWENVEEHASHIATNPYLALAELQLWPHCGQACKWFDLWGFNSVGNRMISDFVMASWAELKETKTPRVA
eukprot:Skav209783  [mRNA]  locus=scaffold9:618069:625030:- [translate_table: standard]